MQGAKEKTSNKKEATKKRKGLRKIHPMKKEATSKTQWAKKKDLR
jgi:hypothetical protein